MAPRRRALRDHDDPRPLMALARAALIDAAEACERARAGLVGHYSTDAASKIIDTSTAKAGHDSPAERA